MHPVGIVVRDDHRVHCLIQKEATKETNCAKLHSKTMSSGQR